MFEKKYHSGGNRKLRQMNPTALSAFSRPTRTPVVPETPQRRTLASLRPDLNESRFLLSSSGSKNSGVAPPTAPTPPVPLKRLKEDLAAAYMSSSSKANSTNNSRAASPDNLRVLQELEMLSRVQEGLEKVDLEAGLPSNAIPEIVEERSLGRGHFGRVVLVRCQNNGRRYALKKGKQVLSRSSKEQVLETLRLWDDLGACPRIVPFLRAWQDEAKVYVLMGYCEGGPLDAFVSRQPGTVTEPQLLGCFRDVLEALCFIHNKHLVHMDCKPSNVVVDARGRCLLADFDLLCEQDTSFGSTDYTYQALEVRDMNYQVHSAADVFSLGISFLELGTRQELPRNGERWEGLRRGAAGSAEYAVLKSSHPLLAAHCVLPCMVTEVKARTSAAALLQANQVVFARVERFPSVLPPPVSPLNRPASAAALSPRASGMETPRNDNTFVSPWAAVGVDEAGLSDRFSTQAVVSPSRAGSPSIRSYTSSPVFLSFRKTPPPPSFKG